WQSAVDSDTIVGINIAALDLYGPTVVGPFDIAIDNLAITADSISEEPGDFSRFNPRIDDVGAKNLLPNASFEGGSTGWSSLGVQTAWGGELSGLYGTIEQGNAWHGDHSLRIDMGPGITPTTYFDGWPADSTVQHAPLAANIGWIEVEPGETLTLSAYMRSDVAGTKARLTFRFADDALSGIQHQNQEVTLTTSWARYTFSTAAARGDVCIALGPDMSSAPN